MIIVKAKEGDGLVYFRSADPFKQFKHDKVIV